MKPKPALLQELGLVLEVFPSLMHKEQVVIVGVFNTQRIQIRVLLQNDWKQDRETIVLEDLHHICVEAKEV